MPVLNIDTNFLLPISVALNALKRLGFEVKPPDIINCVEETEEYKKFKEEGSKEYKYFRDWLSDKYPDILYLYAPYQGPCNEGELYKVINADYDTVYKILERLEGLWDKYGENWVYYLEELK